MAKLRGIIRCLNHCCKPESNNRGGIKPLQCDRQPLKKKQSCPGHRDSNNPTIDSTPTRRTSPDVSAAMGLKCRTEGELRRLIRTMLTGLTGADGKPSGRLLSSRQRRRRHDKWRWDNVVVCGGESARQTLAHKRGKCPGVNGGVTVTSTKCTRDTNTHGSGVARLWGAMVQQ